MFIVITGLSASGKTTLGSLLCHRLHDRGFTNVVFQDGEDMRKRADRVYGHSLEERYKSMVLVEKCVTECRRQNQIPVIAGIFSKRKMFEMVQQTCGPFMVVFLRCPVSVCAERDPKGHYRRAFQDSSEYFVGVTEPIEEPENPDLVLDTADNSIESCLDLLVEGVVNYLQNNNQ